MASGKKNYFRHSMSAFEDDKIQDAIDKLGYEGYAYYFILLEVLAKQCEDEVKNPIRIHQQSLRNVWRKHTKSCIKVVEKLQESGLFVATFNESFIEFDIPNLAKYLGKYSNKSSPNLSNKRKEKKRKEKEKESVVLEIEKPVKNKNTETISEIIEYLNLKTNKKYKSTTSGTVSIINARLNEGYTIKDFEIVINNKSAQWLNDNTMSKFLRPVTLFSNKFESYLNEQAKLTEADFEKMFDAL
ncbi:MAG: putative phage protein (TIGR02220 family) [Enterobacterales bacterium]|jgi:uncharacterized phage protein (TIGR02220 family)